MKKRYIVNFPGHMADCEFNYRRLRRLMPGWLDSDNHHRVQPFPEWCYLVGLQASSEIGFVIQVKESAKYTTTVHIVIYTRLQNKLAWVKNQAKAMQLKATSETGEPHFLQGNKLGENFNALKGYSIDVRLYHDATVAEVIAWQGARRFQPKYEYPNRQMFQRDEKAQINRFLGELLEYCLVEGRVTHNVHAFP